MTTEPPLSRVLDRPLRLAQVADRLGRTPNWLYRHITRLRRDHGFPQPIPGLGGLYDPLAIDDWLAHWRAQQPVAAKPTAAPAPDSEPDWSKILDERAAAFARANGRA